jgi:hypothetical protein
LALALCLSLASGPLLAESVQVTATTVNVRRGPSTSSPVVATAARGEVLDVLERAGEWYRVRTRAGVEGYVSAQFVKPAAAPATGTSRKVAAPAAPAGPAASPAARSAPVPAPAGAARVGRVAITHKDVGCVLAGRFPRLEACFTPAEAVGRAQVQFRADETGPWYAVDMKTEGGCASAVLPKPTASISSFRYFIEVIDRSFTTVDNPDAAPSESFTPRVVGREIDCDQRKIVATSQPTASVLVSVARDAGGKVLQVAAQSAGTPASMAGFSADGVTMGGGSPAGAAEGSKGARASHGARNLAIGGGVAAAGVVVAVAAGGGGSSGSGSSGAGPGGSAPPSGTSPSTSNPLTGHWVGVAGNGEGITYVLTGEGLTCTYMFDITTDLVQSGSTFTGTGTSVARGINCSIPLPSAVTSVFIGQGGSGSMEGTASGGALTFQAGILPFTGTYTATRFDATGTTVIEGFTIQSTWRQTKQ